MCGISPATTPNAIPSKGTKSTRLLRQDLVPYGDVELVGWATGLEISFTTVTPMSLGHCVVQDLAQRLGRSL